MAFTITKNKFHCFIAAGWLVFIAFDFYIYYFRAFDPMTATDTDFFNLWMLQVMRDASLTITLSGMTIFGIWLLRREGFTLRKIFFPLYAILFFFSLAGLSAFGYTNILKIQKFLSIAEDETMNNLKHTLNTEELSSKERSKLSIMYAQRIYKITGEVVEYVTEEGMKKKYEPTLEEKQFKAEITKKNNIINRGAVGLKRGILFWPIVALISIAIGFFTPIKKEGIEQIPT